MKSFVLGICLVVAIIVQLFVLQSWQVEGITPNVLLAFIVIASLFVKAEQLLWMSLAAGTLSDFYSSSDLGLYLGLYLLVAIISKYLLKYGETEFSWWRPLILLALVCGLQSIIVNFGQVGNLSWWAVTKSVMQYVSLTVMVGAIWYLIIKQLDDLIARVSITKAIK